MRNSGLFSWQCSDNRHERARKSHFRCHRSANVALSEQLRIRVRGSLAPVESHPDSLTAARGFSVCLSRETASCHTVAEKWAARLWAMLPLAAVLLARNRLSGNPTNEKENDCPLTAGILSHGIRLFEPTRHLEKADTRNQTQAQWPCPHSEDSGFPFIPSQWAKGALLLSGGSFCSLPSFRFTCPLRWSFPTMFPNHSPNK